MPKFKKWINKFNPARLFQKLPNELTEELTQKEIKTIKEDLETATELRALPGKKLHTFFKQTTVPISAHLAGIEILRRERLGYYDPQGTVLTLVMEKIETLDHKQDELRKRLEKFIEESKLAM